MRKIFTLFAAMLVAASMVADPVVLPDTLDVDNVSFRSEGMPNYVIAEGTYAGTYFDMGPTDDASDTLLYAEWDVTIDKKKYSVAVDVYNTNAWTVQLYLLNQTGDTVKSLRYQGSSAKSGQFTIGSWDLSDLEAGNYKVRARAATAWSAMKLKDVIFTFDYKGVRVALPGTLQPAYAELSSGASVSNNAIAFTPSTANKEYATWNVSFATAGSYKVSIDYTASNGHTYGVALLSEDGTTDVDAVAEAQAWDTGVKELGSIIVPTAGNYLVKLTNGTQHSEAVLNSIKFTAPSKPVTDIDLDEEELSLDVNETGFLHATVLPVDASDPSVTWTSSDPTVATVTNGAVKALKAGTTTITATAGLFSDVCSVTVSDAIPSTDFASPYFFMGTKAQLSGNIYISEADSLHYEDHSVCGNATWKINVTAPCFINATANFKTGSKSGSKLRVVILDSEDAQVGDSLMQDYYNKDGDKAFTGSIVLPKAGIYTVKLVNIQTYSSSKLNGITLTKDASKDVVFKGAWDTWTLHPATSIAADGSSASVKVVLPANDYEFGVTLGGDFRTNGWWLKPEGPTTAEGITGNTGTNMKVCPAFNLEHTFTWTYATNAVTVTFPEVTVYFVNESDWATVKAYAWRGDVKNAEWSGVVLEPTGTKSEGHDVYAYDASAYKNIIFNDGGSNKTGDLAVDPAKPYYYAGDWHETLPDAPTAIDNTVAGEKAVKVLRNGQLFIEKDGKTYNVLGTVVK